MPKQLEELKGFTLGVVSSPSSLDIPKESATYSLNVDSKKEQGAISGIYEPKILSLEGWRDKRYAKWTLTLKEHSSFNLDKYVNKYFILSAYNSNYLIWFSTSATDTTFESVNSETEDIWNTLSTEINNLTDLKIPITGLSSVSAVATVLKNETGIGLGPYYTEEIYNQVAQTWYTVTQTDNTDGSTLLTYESNYLGHLSSPSVFEGTYDQTMVPPNYQISSDYFSSEMLYRGTGISQNISPKWVHVFHEDDKDTLAVINNNNRFVICEDIYSQNNLFEDDGIYINNSGINKITSENRNNNLYIGTGNQSSNISKWFGRINRDQLDRKIENELVLEDSECFPPDKFADSFSYDKVVVPTLNSGMNSVNSMIAGAASVYCTTGGAVGTNFGGGDAQVADAIADYRSLNGWVMKCLANGSHAFKSDWTASDDDGNFDWAKSCKRGMILRVSIGQEGDPTCSSVEQDGTLGAPAAGEAIYELRKIKEIGYGDTSNVGGTDDAQEGVELHDGDLFQVVTVPASGADTLADSGAGGTPAGNVVTYPRLMYVGSLLGNSTLHNSTTAYIPAPAWAYAMQNGSSELTRISLSEARDAKISSENVIHTFSTSGITGNTTNKESFKKRETKIDLADFIDTPNRFNIGTIAECMSSDGLGGIAGRTGEIKELAVSALARTSIDGVEGTGATDVYIRVTVPAHSYQVGDWVTISGSDHNNGIYPILSIPSSTTFVINNKDTYNVTDTTDVKAISANRNYYAGHGKLWVTSDNPEDFDKAWIIDVVNWHGLDEDNGRISVKQVNLNFGRIHKYLVSNEEGYGLLDKNPYQWQLNPSYSAYPQDFGQSWRREPSDSYISGICETYSHQPHLDDGASSGNGTGTWRVWFSYSKKTDEESFLNWDLFLFNIRPTEINEDYDNQNGTYEKVFMYDKTPPYQRCDIDHSILGRTMGLNAWMGIRQIPYEYYDDYWHGTVYRSDDRTWNNHVGLDSEHFLHAGAGKASGTSSLDVANRGTHSRHYLLNSKDKDTLWKTEDTNLLGGYTDLMSSTTGWGSTPAFRDPCGMWHALEPGRIKISHSANYQIMDESLNFGSDIGWGGSRQTKIERHCLVPFFNEWYWTYSEAEQTYEDSAAVPAGGTAVTSSKVAHIITFFGKLTGSFNKSINRLSQKYVSNINNDVPSDECYFSTYEPNGFERRETFEEDMCIFHMHDSPVAFSPSGSDSVTGSTTTNWNGNEIQGRPSIAANDAGTGDVRADYNGDASKHSVKASLGYSKWNQYRWGHDKNGTHLIDTDKYSSDSLWNTWEGYKGADGFGHYNMITTTWDSGEINYGYTHTYDERHREHRYRIHNCYTAYNLNSNIWGVSTPISDGNAKTYTFGTGGEGTGYFTWYSNKDSHVNTTDNGADEEDNFSNIDYKTRGFYPNDSFHYNNADLDTTTDAEKYPTGTPWDNRRINRCWSICNIGESTARTHSALGGRLLVNPRCTFRKLEGWTGDNQGNEENLKYKKLNSVDLIPFYETKTMSRTDSTSANIMRPGLLISGEVEDSINQYTKITVLDTIFWGKTYSDSTSWPFLETSAFKIAQNLSYSHTNAKAVEQAADGYSIVSYVNKKLVLKNLCHSLFKHSVNYDTYCPIIIGFDKDNRQTGISIWRKASWPQMATDQNDAFGTEFPHYTFNRFFNVAGGDNAAFAGLDGCGSSGTLDTTITNRFPTEKLGSTVGAGSGDTSTISGTAGDAGSNLKTSVPYPIITDEGTPSGTNDISEFNTGDLVEYKFSYVYDGYQDSPISRFTHPHNGQGTGQVLDQSYNSINVTLKIPSFERLEINKRVTHLCLWRRNNNYDNFRLVKQIDFSTLKNAQRDADDNFVVDIEDNKSFETFENYTGISEALSTTGMNFALSAQVNDSLFVADCHSKEIKDASFMLFRSLPGKFSVFNWIEDFLALPKKPLALASFGGKLYVFTRENLYRVNPDAMYIENVMSGVGVLNQNSVVVTDFGMFFCDANNMYHHDGTVPKAIGGTVLYNQNNPEWAIGYKRAVDKAIIEGYSPLVEFDGANGLVYFIIRGYSEGVSSYDRYASRAYAYDISTGRFDYLSMPPVSSTSLGRDSDTLLFDNYQIYAFRKSNSLRKDWSWDSKVFDMGSLAVKKVWKSIKISGSPTISNLNGNSSDDILVFVEGVQKNMKIENKNWNASKPIAGFTADQNWNAGTGADSGAIYALAAALPGSGETVNGMTNSDSFALLTTSMPEFVSGDETVQIDNITEGEIETLKYLSAGQYILMELTHSVTNRSVKEIVKVSAINFIWNTDHTISRVEVKCDRGQLGTQAFDFESALQGDANWEHASIRYIGPSLKFPTGTKGNSMQIKFRNQKGFVDSISFVYRNKTLK